MVKIVNSSNNEDPLNMIFHAPRRGDDMSHVGETVMNNTDERHFSYISSTFRRNVECSLCIAKFVVKQSGLPG